MGIFALNIKASGSHGCNRKAAPGDRLHARCCRLDCVDCLSFDFVQNLRQKGFVVIDASFTHHAGAVQGEVVDDLLKNERKSGQF